MRWALFPVISVTLVALAGSVSADAQSADQALPLSGGPGELVVFLMIATLVLVSVRVLQGQRTA